MSLRSLGSLLTRRFSSTSPRGIPRSQPQAEPLPGTGGAQAARGSAAGRSALSLRTLLAPRAAAVVAAAALAGTTLAILYFKDDDTGSAGMMICEKIMNEVTDKKPVINDDVRAGDVVVDQKVISEVCDDDKSKQEATTADSEPDVKKQDMKERFEEWAKEYGKKYRDEEERAMRFEVFKATAEFVDARSPSDQKRMPLGTNFLADWTKEERRRLLACPNGCISVEEAREMATVFPSMSKVCLITCRSFCN